MNPESIIVTGSSGFLGEAIVDEARRLSGLANVIPIPSPRAGGVDLSKPDASDRLLERVPLAHPSETLLVHAAACVRWNDPEGLLDNAAMGVNVGRWARRAGIGFSVLVSGVNVYGEAPRTTGATPCEPSTLYGAGKLAAEHAWKALLPETGRAIVRLAGIWGWQKRPTLFWNRLLLAAAQVGPVDGPPVVQNARPVRNYISAPQAARCVLHVGTRRLAGVFMGAGLDEVDTATYIRALERMPGSRLKVSWQEKGGGDVRVYDPSPELRPHLKAFLPSLQELWTDRPAWTREPP